MRTSLTRDEAITSMPNIISDFSVIKAVEISRHSKAYLTAVLFPLYLGEKAFTFRT